MINAYTGTQIRAAEAGLLQGQDGASLMRRAAHGLARGGAEALLIATNTMHKVADKIEQASGLPLLHIADATADAIVAEIRSQERRGRVRCTTLWIPRRLEALARVMRLVPRPVWRRMPR